MGGELGVHLAAAFLVHLVTAAVLELSLVEDVVPHDECLLDQPAGERSVGSYSVAGCCIRREARRRECLVQCSGERVADICSTRDDWCGLGVSKHRHVRQDIASKRLLLAVGHDAPKVVDEREVPIWKKHCWRFLGQHFCDCIQEMAVECVPLLALRTAHPKVGEPGEHVRREVPQKLRKYRSICCRLGSLLSRQEIHGHNRHNKCLSNGNICR